MPYSIECFLEAQKNVEQVMLVLKIPLTQYSQVEKAVQLYCVLV